MEFLLEFKGLRIQLVILKLIMNFQHGGLSQKPRCDLVKKQSYVNLRTFFRFFDANGTMDIFIRDGMMYFVSN